MKDKSGRELKINDIVVYPTMSGHRIELKYGQVVSTEPLMVAGVDTWPKPRLQRPSRILRNENIFIIEENLVEVDILKLFSKK